MNKIIKFSFAAILPVVFITGVLLALSQFTSPSAQAADCGGSIAGCISINQSWEGTANNSGNNNGGGPGGGGGGSNGGTTTKPKPIPTACFSGAHFTIKEGSPMPYIEGGWHTLSAGGCVKHYKVKTTFRNTGYGMYCSDSTVNGIVRKSVGVIQNDVYTVKFAQKYDPKTGMNTRVYYGYVKTATNYTCIYPKMTQQATNKYCALNATADFNRLANSRLGAAKLRTFKDTIATVNGLKTGSDKCKQSASMNINSGLKSNEKTWGQYRLSGKIQYVRCTQYKVTFNGNTKTQFSCGSPQNTGTVVANITLWCGGVTKGLVNKSWTMNDCLGRSPSQGGFKCTVPKPTYDGKTGTVQTLRDGASRVLNWGTPRTSSTIRNTKNWEQAVTVNKGSSPRLTSVDDNNKSRQMFWSNVSFGTKWIKGQNKQNVAFYNASNPGASWSATRKLRFDGQFKTIVGDINSYNPWTGAVSTSKRTVWVNDYNISCDTAVSPKIQALRSIGDAQ